MPDNNICCTQDFQVGDHCRCGSYNADRSQFTVNPERTNCHVVRVNSLGIEDSLICECQDANHNVIARIAMFGEDGCGSCQKKVGNNDWVGANQVHYNDAGQKQ